jgi:hypothetical protein
MTELHVKTVLVEARPVVLFSADGWLWTSDPADLERIRRRRQLLLELWRRELHAKMERHYF